MNGSEREWKILADAMSQIQTGLCMHCPATRWKLRWSQAGQRWQIVVTHWVRCSVTRSLVNRRRADEFLISLLMLHGVGVAHYGGADHLVVHSKVVLL